MDEYFRTAPGSVRGGAMPRERGHRLGRAAALGVAFGLMCLFAACQAERDAPEEPAPEADEAWWEVENESSQELVELNLIESPVLADAWGPNQLGEATLPATELFRLRQVPCPLTYDQRAVGDAGGFAYRYEVAFECEAVVGWDVAELD